MRRGAGREAGRARRGARERRGHSRAAHYTGSNMNLLPEIPPPSPLHTPRASASVAACGGQRGRNMLVFEAPEPSPPRAVALRRGPRCPCTLASRCALQRWAGEWRVARAQESQSFRAAEAGGRGGASRGRVAKLAAGLLPRLLGSRAAEQSSSRAVEQVEQPQQQLFACSTPTHQPRSLGQ